MKKVVEKPRNSKGKRIYRERKSAIGNTTTTDARNGNGNRRINNRLKKRFQNVYQSYAPFPITLNKPLNTSLIMTEGPDNISKNTRNRKVDIKTENTHNNDHGIENNSRDAQINDNVQLNAQIPMNTPVNPDPKAFDVKEKYLGRLKAQTIWVTSPIFKTDLSSSSSSAPFPLFSPASLLPNQEAADMVRHQGLILEDFNLNMSELYHYGFFGEESEETTIQESSSANNGWAGYENKPLGKSVELTLEEAFFLCFSISCLTILDDQLQVIPVSRMWDLFEERRKGFKVNYIVYHYYRAKGWVPKSGLKYGSDWTIYRKGPPFYHSDFGILVQTQGKPEVKEMVIETQRERKLSWLAVSNLVRVTSQVSKDVVIISVILPASVSEIQPIFKDPLSTLSSIQVREQIIRRWIPQKERL